MNGDWAEGSAVIQDETGLHARPAVKLTKRAKQFGSEVQIRAAGQADWTNAKSPNAVMKLRAAHRTTLEIRASGADAGAAVAALETLINENFHEPATG